MVCSAGRTSQIRAVHRGRMMSRLFIPNLREEWKNMSELAGTWTVDLVTPIASDSGRLHLVVEAQQITGQMENGKGEVLEIDEGAVDGSDFKFIARIVKPFKLNMTWTGSVTDDEISGVVKLGPIGKGTFTGSRVS